ncbi:lipopolysaccharide ABC transporter permease LptF [Rickettsiales bacterium Ac37b]|nr:lipopolysaccharide ABC transporter permease LptF [Rickettsiales bacterium Ac37b]
MKLYVKYILKELTSLVILISFALTAIIFLSQSLRYLTLVTNNGIYFIDFLQLSILMVPYLLMIILPIASFISVIYVYNKFIMDGELIVLSSTGLNRFALSLPAFIMTFVILIISYTISLYVSPISYNIFKNKIAFYKENYTSIFLEDGVFNEKKGLTIYIAERTADDSFNGIFIYDARTTDTTTLMAETAKLITKDNFISFELYNGNRQKVNKYNELDILYFDYLSYNIELKSNNYTTRWREPQERYLNELLYPPQDEIPEMFNKLKAEAHYRLTWPLLNFILTIMALIAIYPRHFSRRGQAKRITFTSICAIAMIVLFIGFNNIITITPKIVPSIYGIIGLIIIFCNYLLFCRYRAL